LQQDMTNRDTRPKYIQYLMLQALVVQQRNENKDRLGLSVIE